MDDRTGGGVVGLSVAVTAMTSDPITNRKEVIDDSSCIRFVQSI